MSFEPNGKIVYKLLTFTEGKFDISDNIDSSLLMPKKGTFP